MERDNVYLSQRRLRTPRAAAIAGILFAILQIASTVMLLIAIPVDSYLEIDLLGEQSDLIGVSLGLIPFAGIAFLWFMGVVRDRMGHLEDQFFSTLFFGSGLLYLAMTFSTAAIAGGILAVYRYDPNLVINSGFYYFGRAIIYKFDNVYAIRMAGMFLTALGTIWVRTKLMPRWIALLTYVTALVLLIGIDIYPWTSVMFPGFVFLVSAYILMLNYRYTHGDGVTLEE
jgi:hypothetical protein